MERSFREPVPEWERAGAVAGLSYCLLDRLNLLFGAIRFDAGDGALQPVLHILAQLLFRLVGCGDRYPLPIQRNVMARHVFGAVLLGDEVIQQAFMAGMWAHGISVVGARQRVLEDGSRPPRRTVPI